VTCPYCGEAIAERARFLFVVRLSAHSLADGSFISRVGRRVDLCPLLAAD
jgi:hypothetical protein